MCEKRFMRRKVGERSIAALTLLLLASVLPGPVRAQMLPEEVLEQQGLGTQPASGDWNVTLGAGLAARPTYPGANGHRATIVPLFYVSYKDIAFVGPLGLGVNAINWGGLRAGPILGFEGGRDQDSSSHLNGLGNIDASLTAGGFVSYRFGPFDLAGTVRQAISHSSNGLNALVQANYRTQLVLHSLLLTVGPDLQFADRRYDQTWFGVTAQQSQQSGLPMYSPGGGIRDFGLHATLTYRFSDHILLHAFGRLSKLAGDDADSPIVEDKTQFFAGAGLGYHF